MELEQVKELCQLEYCLLIRPIVLVFIL